MKMPDRLWLRSLGGEVAVEVGRDDSAVQEEVRRGRRSIRVTDSDTAATSAQPEASTSMSGCSSIAVLSLLIALWFVAPPDFPSAKTPHQPEPPITGTPPPSFGSTPAPPTTVPQP